jgi:glycosyltransferase involved in cell wall biosynthesis
VNLWKSDLSRVMLDITDLVQHHLQNRVLTGVQRVQAEVAAHLLPGSRLGSRIQLVCYMPNLVGWVEVPRHLFAALVNSPGGGEGGSADSRQVATQIQSLLSSTMSLRIRSGTTLLNLGSSWWLPNYLLAVQCAQAQGLRYVPFVHDCIPILRPDLCVPGLPAQFLGWLAGAGLTADGMITSTREAASHVQAALLAMGIKPSPVGIVPLDARSRLAEPVHRKGAMSVPIIPDRPFVLLVSTLERRKGHALAFRAWLHLADRYPPDVMPLLVCVGKPGWRNEEAYEMFASRPRLRELVVIISDLDDVAVAVLYDRCLCTLYPSQIEGWGLPVTEALSVGKIPIVARTLGVTEAAGALGEYFSPGSLPELIAAVERVCFDKIYRDAAEARILAEFRPRSWQEVSKAFLDEAHAAAAQPHRPIAERVEGLGRYFSFCLNEVVCPGLDVAVGEHLRFGSGWLAPEVSGCPTLVGGAEIRLPIRQQEEPITLSLCFRNNAGAALVVDISIAGKTARHSLRVGETQWAILALDAHEATKKELSVMLRSRPAHPIRHAGRGVDVIGALVSSGRDMEASLRRAVALQFRIAKGVVA